MCLSDIIGTGIKQINNFGFHKKNKFCRLDVLPVHRSLAPQDIGYIVLRVDRLYSLSIQYMNTFPLIYDTEQRALYPDWLGAFSNRCFQVSHGGILQESSVTYDGSSTHVEKG